MENKVDAPHQSDSDVSDINSVEPMSNSNSYSFERPFSLLLRQYPERINKITIYFRKGQDDEIIEDVEAYADEMVKMFGGQGVKLEETEYSISDLGVGRSLH